MTRLLLAALARCTAGLLILLSSLATAHAQENVPQVTPPTVRVTTETLDKPATPCVNRFVTHTLDHVITVDGPTVDQFEANGSGLGIGDLDNDGDLDIVLGNDAGSNTILWNEGGLDFRVESMDHGSTRAVNLVDVDGDGWLDIVFTQRRGGLVFWHNTGKDGRFVRETLPGVAHPAYAMAWADLDDDGDLDLVTGSYDAGLLSDLGNSFLMHG
ncbi:MAG: VCBS repeat-containing protein, partial [Anaerolineae bacterium]|nr:VCBS repeat-containing protein [Anaerolineae bacterium]